MPLPKHSDANSEEYLQENLHMMQFLMLEGIMQAIGEKIGKKRGLSTMRYFFKFITEKEKKFFYSSIKTQNTDKLDEERKWEELLNVFYDSRNVAHHRGHTNVLGLFSHKRFHCHSFAICNQNNTIKYQVDSSLQFSTFQKIFERNFLAHFFS